MSVPEGDVVLLVPPYFGLCGSHNDRAAPTHTSLSRFLEDAGISDVVYNADCQPEILASERRNVDKPTEEHTPRDWHGTGFWLELPPFELAVEPICEIRLPEGEIMRTVLLEHPPCASS